MHAKLALARDFAEAHIGKQISKEVMLRGKRYTSNGRNSRKKAIKMTYQEAFIQNLNGLRVGFPDKKVGLVARKVRSEKGSLLIVEKSHSTMRC